MAFVEESISLANSDCIGAGKTAAPVVIIVVASVVVVVVVAAVCYWYSRALMLCDVFHADLLFCHGYNPLMLFLPFICLNCEHVKNKLILCVCMCLHLCCNTNNINFLFIGISRPCCSVTEIERRLNGSQ